MYFLIEEQINFQDTTANSMAQKDFLVRGNLCSREMLLMVSYINGKCISEPITDNCN